MTKEDHPRTRQNDVMPPTVKVGQQPVKNSRRDDAPHPRRIPTGRLAHPGPSPEYWNRWITHPIWTIMDWWITHPIRTRTNLGSCH